MNVCVVCFTVKLKVKAKPSHDKSGRGPWGSRRLRFQNF
jgi:hypothetical protein